jgi:3-keto-disaccharide hydrolase
MKTQFLRKTVAFLAFLAFTGALSGRAAEANQLTREEKAAGWKLLFDGKTLQGWRNFKKKEPPKQGWVIEEGALKHVAKGGGGDIITDAEFNDFELEWEWKVPEGANSGLKYFITEERSSAIGHEYQLVDDLTHPDARAGWNRSAGAFYHVLEPDRNKVLKPVGEWNRSRVLVQGNHVEHWLNGGKVLEYELGSEAVKAAVAKSKFKDVAGFGTKIKGHILLQDHGDEISFRNLKIRELRAK